ncbi:alpha-1-inhibitor 3-like [Anopheles nili]|uniref:alpha-1-inhibitor 3-like n=1 Tax=Anopheles nili TaxID=185578 RepID=UPI00237BEE4A|nr:alpha-1-inhibitor 3-like [Anopheles nili]
MRMGLREMELTWIRAFLVFYFALGIPQDCAGQRYVILAPRMVRPHSTYDLVVTNVATSKQRFRCEIVNASDAVLGSTSVDVNPNEIRKVEVYLDSMQMGSYRLKVWDEQQSRFLNATELEYTEKSYLVLFQTDKQVYKPGDRVQFRVVFLFPDTTPVWNAVRPSIFITDPDRYRMRQWLNVTLQSGVFEGSFQLAQYTSAGLWTISTLVNDQSYKDSFHVEEYTLPLFKISTLSVPNAYFNCDEPRMFLKLAANYAHGGSVRGTATVVVRANYNNYPSQTKEVGRKQVPIDGTVLVDFPTAIVAPNCTEERTVWFDVTVTEGLTGVSYNVISQFTVYNSQGVTMEVVDRNDAFYPGLAMQMKVRLTNVHETPLQNRHVTILYRVLKNHEDEVITNLMSLKTNVNGIVKFSINTTLDTVEVDVEGVYKNNTYELMFAYPAYEDRSLDYLAIYTRQAYYVVHRNITVDIHSNVKLMRIYYVGITRGKVSESGLLESLKPGNTHHLVLKARPQMLPQMRLLVYTVLEDGKILSVSSVVHFLPPKNSLIITQTPTEPNKDAYKFNISAEEGAFVGLLGVDERINYGTVASNDISVKKLENALRSQEDSSSPWLSHDSFGSVGVKLITDGYLPDVGFVPHSFVDFERRSAPHKEVTVREDFPETWIWESLAVPNGKGSVVKKLPDTLTTWHVTGFSVGRVYGLQILEKPLRVKPTKRIFAQLHAPSSIKCFEEVTVHCLVHNNGKPVNVTLEMRDMLPVTPIFLEQGTTKSVRLKLHATRLGTLPVEIIVKGARGATIDHMIRSIAVHPEGVMKTIEDVRLLNFPTQSKLSFNLSLPVHNVNRTTNHFEAVTLSLVGSFLNLNQFDLEHLLTASHGNGEESLMYLQTTMAIYEYLLQAQRLQQGSNEKFISYLEAAHQQLLQFRLEDGSFSMFGYVHQCGGVWFTAATVEALSKLSAYVPVADVVMIDALDWLAEQSRDDGSFNESCAIAHPHIQRTGGKELSLASSVLFAFVDHKFSARYESLINKTVTLLLSSDIRDVYVLAKVSYLLALIDHPQRTEVLEKLNKLAVVEGVYRFWRVTQPSPNEKRNQEATAYALLANLKANAIEQLELVRIAQWIQKHSLSGERCVPSLDKIVALRGLAMFRLKIPKSPAKLFIEAGSHRFEVNASNQDLLQTVSLPDGTTDVRVTARGTGLLLIKLALRYSVPTNSSSSVGVQIQKTASVQRELSLLVCILAHPRNAYQSKLLMVAIDLPTGYELDQRNAEYDNGTKSVNVMNNNTELALVWDTEEVAEFCCTVKAMSRFTMPEMLRGLVYLFSFDTKDVIEAFEF